MFDPNPLQWERAPWGLGRFSSSSFTSSRTIARRAPLDLSFKDEAAACGLADSTSLGPRHARLETSSNVAELPGFETGAWWVQDLAASLPARLVPASARTVLDLCAAPGGKTMQLAAAGHAVTGVDRKQSRLARLQQNLDRTKLAATLVEADALTWRPDERFDAILIDAPCSSTGTFRRHPEVLYRARPSIIAETVTLQTKLLAHAATLLAPGGALVFATCSLEREEGEDIVAAFLAANPGFAVAPPTPGELPDFVVPTAAGFVRILPGLLEAEGGLDGFFIARLVARA